MTLTSLAAGFAAPTFQAMFGSIRATDAGMEALKNVVDGHGVNFMATICAICKAQFSKVLPYYGFNMSMVGGVHQLVSKAIRLGEPH